MKKVILEPPPYLLEKILKRIEKERRILVLKHTAIFSVIFLVSIIAFIPASKILWQDFKNSGFIYFFSLIFSDFSIVIIYWRSLALQLLETLPAMSLALFLAVVLIFLQSLKSLIKNIKTLNYYNYGTAK